MVKVSKGYIDFVNVAFNIWLEVPDFFAASIRATLANS